MYLKRIDIFGFKSFGQDVHLDIPPGITVLVGPNGGGKSNVVDAVRWALGEQRVRELRAERTEDLIFNGSAGRHASRMAEVTLSFDNSDNEMVHWPEFLTIGRRLYRNGDAEYVINGKTVRLKDVTDLFLDSGLGRFNYAVISQGRVEGALLQKPRDRFEQLEEAAGVSRYKVRRKETLQHLGEVEAHLARIRDLRHDLSRQMESVQSKAQNENEYLKLEAERKVWQVRLELTHYHKDMIKQSELERIRGAMELEYQQIEGEIFRLEEQIRQYQEELSQRELLTSDRKSEIRGLEDQLASADNQRAEWDKEVSGLEREYRIFEEQGETVRHRVDALQSELTALQKPMVVEDSPRLQTLQALRRTREEHGQAIAQWETVVSQRRESRARILMNRDEVARELARIEGALGVFSEEDRKCISFRPEFIASLADEVETLAKTGESLRHARHELKERLRQQQGELDQLRRHMAQDDARLKALRQLEEEGEGLPVAIRSLLKLKNHENSGILGILGALIEAPSDVTLAIQTALGGAYQDVVVDNEHAARKAINLLKENRWGRATFLPLDTIRASQISDTDKAWALESGAVGWAVDLVHFAPEIQAAVRHVLGRVLVCETIDDAVRLGKIHRFRYKTVTLDGQVLHAGGAMTGGSQKTQDARAMRKVEMDRLNHSVKTQQQQVKRAEHEVQGISAEVERLEADAESLQSTLMVRRNRLTALKQLTASGMQSVDPSQLLARQGELSRHVVEIDGELEAALEKISEAKQQEQSMSQQIRGLESVIDQEHNAWERYQLMHQRITDDLATVNRQLTQSQSQIGILDTKISGAKDQLAVAMQAVHHLKGVLQELYQTDRTDGAEVSAIREKILTHDNRLRVLRTEERRMVSRRNTIEQELVQIPIRWENYEPDRQIHVLPDDEVSGAQRRVAALVTAVEQLGPIVPGSLNLYDQLADREKDLRGEEDDVLKARAELMATLTDLDQEVEGRVNETARQVEEAFSQACRELYGGGEGGFSWIRGDEGGVELWVKPLGKKPSSLTLLSGGEKALGGIAWLFALLSVRPSPFVIMDEVEASLDEANAVRFADYIKKYRQQTQYIIVTHHKATMEVADALWGVSGNGEGHSRLVSVVLQGG